MCVVLDTRLVLIFFTLVVLTMLTMGVARPLLALEVDTPRIYCKDFDGDGKPDVAKILFDFDSNNTTDLITVWDRDGDMVSCDSVGDCCDFDRDVWIFDAGNDNLAELIIVFSMQNKTLVADFYDDVDGDGQVRYRLLFAHGKPVPKVVESRYPTLRVFANDGFWVKDGKPSHNITIFGDGDVNLGQVYCCGNMCPHDGETDFRITIRDLDGDLDPEYELREAKQCNKKRGDEEWTMITLDWDDKELEWGGSIFFPFLGKGPGWWERGRKSARPPILVDWEKAKISTIQLTVSDRMDDGNCFILTPGHVTRGELNIFTFEYPFCFYDLAEDDDNTAELVVRIGFFHSGFPHPGVCIRYDWDMDNSGGLDFGISACKQEDRSYDFGSSYLEGDSLVSVVELGDFSLFMPPFEKLPEWVLEPSRRWNKVCFSQTNGIWGVGEGIYCHASEVNNYLPTKIGFKTECDLDAASHHLKLYLSTIDMQLHLFGADVGTFLISAVKTGDFYGTDFSRRAVLKGEGITLLETIEYHDTDLDGYIDRWVHKVGGEEQQHLFLWNGLLVYVDPLNEVATLVKLPGNRLQNLNIPVFIPRSHEELAFFNQKLRDLGFELIKAKRLMVGDGVVRVTGGGVDKLTNFRSLLDKFGDDKTILKGFMVERNSPALDSLKIICPEQCTITTTISNEEKVFSRGEYLLKYHHEKLSISRLETKKFQTRYALVLSIILVVTSLAYLHISKRLKLKHG